MNAAHIDMFADVDVIRVGARNMQNFEMLKELGRSRKPVLHELAHLPVVVDPSHACGQAKLVAPMAMAAAACGADGVMIEVHNNPSKALCDGPQSLTPEQFEGVVNGVMRIHEATEII